MYLVDGYSLNIQYNLAILYSRYALSYAPLPESNVPVKKIKLKSKTVTSSTASNLFSIVALGTFVV
jgi:hypothetical protein